MPQAVNTVYVPENGRNYRPKHVELIEIVNKIIIDQQAASSVLYTISCKHSIALLRMGEIIARNMLSWLKLLIKLLLLRLVNCLCLLTQWILQLQLILNMLHTPNHEAATIGLSKARHYGGTFVKIQRHPRAQTAETERAGIWRKKSSFRNMRIVHAQHSYATVSLKFRTHVTTKINLTKI